MTRSHVGNDETLRIETADVVIVEGTIALALLNAVPRSVAQAWFVEVDEHERKRRVVQEYQLRGMSVDEAEAIYQSRQEDESPVVIATKELTTHCIHLELPCTLSHYSDSNLIGNNK